MSTSKGLGVSFVEVLVSSEVKARLTGMPRRRCLPVLSPVLHHRTTENHVNNGGHRLFSDRRIRPLGEGGRGSASLALSALGRISGGPDRPFSWPGRRSVALPRCYEQEAESRCGVSLGRQHGPHRGGNA